MQTVAYIGRVTAIAVMFLMQSLWCTLAYLARVEWRDIRETMSHYLDCLRRDEFCGSCYANRTGRSNYKGHFGYRKARKLVSCMSLLRRTTETGTAASSVKQDPGSDKYWQKRPDLFAFLSASAWPDGSSRLTGTLMLFVDGAVWKAWLHDKDQALGCFVSASSLNDCLDAAERAVGDPGADWRPDRKGAKRG